MFTVSSLRSAFPFFNEHPDWVYLDSAATAQKPQVMMDALQQHFVAGVANVHRAAHQLANRVTTEFEQARADMAAFLHAPSAANIVWTRGTTDGINLIVNGWARHHLRAGDVVVISALEHHANLVPWQQLCAQMQLELRVLPITDQGELDRSAWDRIFDSRVKVLSITAMSNVLGTLTPINELIQRAHHVGAICVVDAAQFVAHQIIDVQQLGCDFLVFSGHKLYGPNGVGVLYGKTQRLDEMQPAQFGGEMVRSVTWQHSEFQAPPLKFEAGTPPIAEAIALAASVRFLQTHDRAAALDYEKHLLNLCEQGIDQISGVTRFSRASERAGLCSFVVAGQHPIDVAAQLDQHQIAVRAGNLCAMPLLQRLNVPGLVRVSFGVYNNEHDVKKFLSVLRTIVVPQPSSVSATKTTSLISQLEQTKNWEARYRILLQQAQHHQPWSIQQRELAQAITGCESATWLRIDKNGEQCCFEVDSEARIVIGLSAVILELVNGKTAAEIAAINIAEVFKRLGISGNLSPSRNNGVLAIIHAIRQQLPSGDVA